MGISMDDQPGDAAREAGRLEGISTEEKIVKRVTASVGATFTTSFTAALKIKTSFGPLKDIETVVITGKDMKLRQAFTLELTLSRNFELTIEPKTPEVRLVVLSLALARLAPNHPSDNCRALLEDGQRCHLLNVGSGFCTRHAMKHQYLHEEQLKGPKVLTELDIKTAGSTPKQNQMDVYDKLQQDIALRTFITRSLYGDEDDGHSSRVIRVVEARSNLDKRMAHDRTDASRRRPVTAYVDHFLGQADRSERHFHLVRPTPYLYNGGESREIINLRDVKEMLAMLRKVHITTPTLSEVFCPPNSSQLREDILERIDELGDLPAAHQRPREQEISMMTRWRR